MDNSKILDDLSMGLEVVTPKQFLIVMGGNREQWADGIEFNENGQPVMAYIIDHDKISAVIELFAVIAVYDFEPSFIPEGANLPNDEKEERMFN